MIKKYCVAALLLILSGCGWHLRNASNLPTQLQQVYIAKDGINAAFVAKLERLLRALHVQLTAHRQSSRYVLDIQSYQLSQSVPALATTSISVTYPVILNVSVQLLQTHRKRPLGIKRINIYRTQILNANEITPPVIAAQVKRLLDEEAINLIYYWLSSDKVAKRIARQK